MESVYAIEAVQYPDGMPDGTIEDLMAVLSEVADERHGLDRDVGRQQLCQLPETEFYSALYARVDRLVDCVCQPTADYRRHLLEVAATAVAAIQAWDHTQAANAQLVKA